MCPGDTNIMFCYLPFAFCLRATSGVHHHLEYAVTLRGVTLLSSTDVRVVFVHSPFCTMSAIVQLSSSMLLLSNSRCHGFAAWFVLSSDFTLTSHPITSRLVSILPTSSLMSARWHIMTSHSDGVVSLSLTTHISSPPISGVLNINAMIAVIVLYVALMAFPG